MKTTLSLHSITPILAAATLAAAAVPAAAHDGRRFQVEVANGRLQARGANSADAPIDPAGLRPYTNAIHGHWDQIGSSVTAGLPGYDAGAGSLALTGHDVTLTLTGVSKWTGVSANLVDPDATGGTAELIAGTQVKPGTTANFRPLDGNETIAINIGGAAGVTVSSADLNNPAARLDLPLITGFDGRLAFDENGLAVFPGQPSNGYDIDLTYVYTGLGAPADTLYAIEAVLSTNAPGIADSQTVYTLLSPDGSGPIERLHFASLFAEQTLGTPVPEPAGLALLSIGGLTLALRRRRPNRVPA